MKWTVSDIIALIAVIGSSLSPIATAFFNWRKSNNEEKQKHNEQQLELDKENFQEFNNHYRKIFEEYIQQTKIELAKADYVNSETFSDRQRKLEALVLIYSDANVRSAIIEMDRFINSGTTNKSFDDEILKIIEAFNLQWQKQLPRLH